jgi:hypothetical protein
MTRIIDLSSPEGNAFALMGLARAAAQSLHWTDAEASALVDEMRNAPNYAALLDVMDRDLPGRFAFRNDPRDYPQSMPRALSVAWTRPKLRRFKRALDAETRDNGLEGGETITFEGVEYTAMFAAYLIEYLDARLPR